MATTIIVGSSGQDGRLLYRYLAERGDVIVGIARGSTCSTEPGWGRKLDISDPNAVSEIIHSLQPHEIYYLAAYHHASEDIISSNADFIRRSFEVNLFSLINFLDAIRRLSPKTRIFYAASSHLFGDPTEIPQNERTPINPICVYGTSKAAGVHVCRYYRNTYSLFASVGILYNHESSLRGPSFVTQKIIRGAISIKNKQQDEIILGDLDAIVDWGYAPNYVEAMHRILLHDRADDFVIATGVRHTVRDFVDITFGLLGLDWRRYVKIDQSLLRNKKRMLIGDASKLMEATGWRPTVGFEEMIRTMLIELGASQLSE